MWYKSESNIKPLTFEKNVDGSFYVRRNIEEFTRTFENSDDPITFYSYEEAHLAAEYYDIYTEILKNSDSVIECRETIAELFELMIESTSSSTGE